MYATCPVYLIHANLVKSEHLDLLNRKITGKVVPEFNQVPPYEAVSCA
jgi:hypothetical protein